MFDIEKELERRLSLINAALEGVLRVVGNAYFPDPKAKADMLESLMGAEQLSRWKRSPLPDDPEQALTHAKCRAEFKAHHHSRPYVVVEDGNRLIVLPKAELEDGRVVGLPKDTKILFEAGA